MSMGKSEWDEWMSMDWHDMGMSSSRVFETERKWTNAVGCEHQHREQFFEGYEYPPMDTIVFLEKLLMAEQVKSTREDEMSSDEYWGLVRLLNDEIDHWIVRAGLDPSAFTLRDDGISYIGDE